MYTTVTIRIETTNNLFIAKFNERISDKFHVFSSLNSSLIDLLLNLVVELDLNFIFFSILNFFKFALACYCSNS